ncbi:MAG: hypothetical protein QXJ96_00195 [Candidatus Aenigmatarchaeota archaeon]|nr:hypothetical protein [Candidatus Aenigmarchaeota archaeon]
MSKEITKMIIDMITIQNKEIDKFGQVSSRVNIKRNASKIIREILICFISMLLVVSSNARKINVINKEIKMFFEK